MYPLNSVNLRVRNMDLDTFSNLCELRAIQYFDENLKNIDQLDIDKESDRFAECISHKKEDKKLYRDVAKEICQQVYSNPNRYTRLLSSNAASKTKAAQQLFNMIEGLEAA